MTSFRNQLHPSWAQVMQDLLPLLDEIEEQLLGKDFLPAHQNVMKAAFDAKGLTNVSSVDVHPLIVQTYGPITMANIANYHGIYAPPFCHAAAKSLFDAMK